MLLLNLDLNCGKVSPRELTWRRKDISNIRNSINKGTEAWKSLFKEKKACSKKKKS